jgi:hypothetical protein
MNLTGAEAVVEMLKAHGVEVIFGLCGDTSLPLYDALARLPHGMKHILTRDERHAAYMADGYARVTGKVGVCEGPSGGGATYLLPGLVEANESSVPVLGINTDVSVASRGRFTLTELDQGALMKPLTKWNAVLDRSADIPRRPCGTRPLGRSRFGGGRVHDRAHARDPVGGEAAALRVLLDDLRRVRVVDAVQLVVHHVAMHPLNVLAQRVNDAVRLLRHGAQLLAAELTRARQFPLDHVFRHGRPPLVGTTLTYRGYVNNIPTVWKSRTGARRRAR